MKLSDFESLEQHEWEPHFEILQDLGRCHASLGNHAEAKYHFERAANLEPDAPAPYVGLGVIALQDDQLDDAEIAFRVACRLDNGDSKAYAGLAMVAQRRSDYKSAFDFYLKSLELDTDNLTALLGLFQSSCQMGSFAQVTHYLELYLSLHPTDASVMFSLAALYMKDNLPMKAKPLLETILSVDAANSDAQDLLEEVEHNLAQTPHDYLVYPSVYRAGQIVSAQEAAPC